MNTTQIMVILAAMAVASCTHPAPYTPQASNVSTTGIPRQTAKQRQYLALPGRSAVRVSTADTDEAFDRQVAAYSQGAVPAPVAVATPGYNPNANYTPNVVDPSPAAPVQPVWGGTQPTMPAAQQPAQDGMGDGIGGIPAMNPDPVSVEPVQQPTNVGASADFAVQITNATTGRLYVEAYDAANHIFPCGPMFAGQVINTPPDPVGPLTGPITVIIRDPDKPGAPEIRRYKVDPPAVYKGKTVGITILPGGRYRADVDNEIYYTSPDPKEATSAGGVPAPVPAQ